MPDPEIATHAICQRCRASGKDFTARRSRIEQTCMGDIEYFDSNGRHHHHDPNTFTRAYSCSNGHRWARRWKRPCWCSWEPGEPYGGAYQELPDAGTELRATGPGIARMGSGQVVVREYDGSISIGDEDDDA